MILKLKVWLLKKLLNDVSKHGHDGDVYLAHINKFEDKLLKAVGGEGSVNPDTGLVQYKGGGGGSTTTNEIDPKIWPYVEDVVKEGQRLYGEGAPQYYGGQTYLDPNSQQQQAIKMMTDNAYASQPMLQNASDLNNKMIQGDFLQNNPNFDAVMNTAGRKATELFNTATQGTSSNVSQGGRYGSNAHARLQGGNAGKLATSLADTAGQYAYQNYATERGNQNIGANNLMNAGNMQAGFDQTKLNADIARHDYGQNAQQQHLSNYTNAVWGAPGGSSSTTSNSGGGK